jgi:hypothetical protein
MRKTRCRYERLQLPATGHSGLEKPGAKADDSAVQLLNLNMRRVSP